MIQVMSAVFSLVSCPIGQAAIAAAIVPACGGLALRLFRHRF